MRRQRQGKPRSLLVRGVPALLPGGGWSRCARGCCCRGGLAPAGCRGGQGSGPKPAAGVPGGDAGPHLRPSLIPLLGGSLLLLCHAAAAGACAAHVCGCGQTLVSDAQAEGAAPAATAAAGPLVAARGEETNKKALSRKIRADPPKTQKSPYPKTKNLNKKTTFFCDP